MELASIEKVLQQITVLKNQDYYSLTVWYKETRW